MRWKAVDTIVLATGLVLVTFLSSWFGLTREHMFDGSNDDGESGFQQSQEFFGMVWEASGAADTVFILGSALAIGASFVGGILIVRKLGWVGMAISPFVGGVAFILHWLTYAFSFQLLYPALDFGEFGPSNAPAPPFGDAMDFTREYGWPGLVLVGALAPVLAMLIAALTNPPGTGLTFTTPPSPADPSYAQRPAAPPPVGPQRSALLVTPAPARPPGPVRAVAPRSPPGGVAKAARSPSAPKR